MTPEKTLQQLFDDYVQELDAARVTALRRCEGRLKTWTRRLGNEARAREKLASEAPPCTDTRVIYVLRKYWLTCDTLRRNDPAAPTPAEFILGWLKSLRPELAAFLEPLPYWPLGKDERGNWI